MRPTRRAVLASAALLLPAVRAAAQAVEGDVEVLQAVLRVEHATVHGYGVAGARLPAAERDRARRYADVHRLHRDLLRAAVSRHGGVPVPAEPAYAAPPPPASPAAARTAVRGVEWAALLAYRAALPRLSAPGDRGLLAAMYVRSAEHAVALGVPPAAFPGRR